MLKIRVSLALMMVALIAAQLLQHWLSGAERTDASRGSAVVAAGRLRGGS